MIKVASNNRSKRTKSLKIILSGKFVSGKYVNIFEKYSKHIGTKYSVADYGTAALHAALNSLGLGKGDEVSFHLYPLQVPPRPFYIRGVLLFFVMWT